jgi:hypothetical protein
VAQRHAVSAGRIQTKGNLCFADLLNIVHADWELLNVGPTVDIDHDRLLCLTPRINGREECSLVFNVINACAAFVLTAMSGDYLMGFCAP